MNKNPSSRREFLKVGQRWPLWRELVAVAFASCPALTWNRPSSYTCPRWFQEAKFGIWLHWGPQTLQLKGGGLVAHHMYMGPGVLPATEQKGKHAWEYHRKAYEHQSEIGYKDVCNL